MIDSKKVAVVTGANRGLGFETCRQLAQRGFQVILTSRSETKGTEARHRLQTDGLSVDYHQLDVTDPSSIARLAQYLRTIYDGVDVLVNNAGIMERSPGTESLLTIDLDTVRRVFETNLFGALTVSQALVPLMKVHNYGRVVNVSSGLGQLDDMQTNWVAYRMTKTALNAFTRILAQEVKSLNILVNAVCPGWVRTDLGGPHAPRGIEEGVDTIVWAATLPDGGPTGGYFRDREEIAW